jgi:asparagine synthase (glutamine-hydrolysing)
MCGIAGIVQFDSGAPVDEAALEVLNASCATRGPDAAGLWRASGVGLAHRRLSILDLSERGRQPMLDPTGRVAITYNGEIYNFRELRKELETHGHTFRSESDTEMLLAGYLQWGAAPLARRLDGMFAFGLHDLSERATYLCRDRFGKKPLYYRKAPDHLAFCSDIRGLWATERGLTLDHEALDHYLSELATPQPRTIWKEIQQVRPAHVLRVSDQGATTEEGYWRRTYSPKSTGSEAQQLEVLEGALRTAVMKRTLSDVPIGAFLSGGVDSGLVVAFLAQGSAGPVRTYSVCVPGHEMDEGPIARKVAERYSTRHTEITLGAQNLDVLPEIVDAFGEPFADSSAIPSWHISREIRRHVTVVLSGDGGDEMFGYPEYVWAHRADVHQRRYPGAAQRAVVRALDKARRMAGLPGKHAGFIQDYAALSGSEKLFRTMGFSSAEKAELYLPDAARAANDFTRRWLDEGWEASRQTEMADTLTEASFGNRLLNDYLVKVDRASMAHSLEVRSPFLDGPLAEIACRLPNELRYKGGEAKYLLKTLAEKHVSPDIRSHPKRGFAVPVAEWLRGDLRGMTEDLLRSSTFKSRGLFEPARVECFLDQHLTGKRDHSHRLWTLLCFELWCRRFMDTAPGPSAAAPRAPQGP